MALFNLTYYSKVPLFSSLIPQNFEGTKSINLGIQIYNIKYNQKTQKQYKQQYKKKEKVESSTCNKTLKISTQIKIILTACCYHVTYVRIYALQLPKCQGTPCSKQQRDSNPQPLSSQINTQPFSQTGLWLNSRVIVYEISGCGFKSGSCHSKSY